MTDSPRALQIRARLAGRKRQSLEEWLADAPTFEGAPRRATFEEMAADEEYQRESEALAEEGMVPLNAKVIEGVLYSGYDDGYYVAPPDMDLRPPRESDFRWGRVLSPLVGKRVRVTVEELPDA